MTSAKDRAPPARRAALLAGAAALAVAWRAQAADVGTAVDAAATGVGLDEIVVTAQKRATNLQDTPISISVMGGEDLQQRHVQSLADLSDGAIPSLRVAPFFARSSALILNMRGIGGAIDANQPARDQAVGVYADGVYMGRAQGLGSALYDIDRIEVLKGPQGTLFGRNTEGGAISIVTKAPTGRYGFDGLASYGDYDGYKVAGHLNLPAVHDISLKFDGLVSRRDGTVKNPTTSGDPDFNAYDKRGVQVEALWRPTDGFSAEYAFDYSYDATTPYYVQLQQAGSLPLAPIIHLQPDRAKVGNVGVPLQWSVGKTWGHRLNLDWTLAENLELKSISSYRRLRQSQFDNGETILSVFAPNAPFSRYSLAHTWQTQYSEELQLVGKLPQVEFVAGALYFQEKVRDNAQTPNTLQFNATGTAYTTLSVDLNAVPFDRAAHVKTESYGVFGQATWTPPMLDERAHLTLGGRYTHDAKTGGLDVVNGALPSYVDASGQRITGVIPLDASWNHFDPLVVLAFDAAPGVNLYGKWSTGYRAGGANSRSLTFRAFDPEKVKMLEAGFKSEFWDHRARLNLAVFRGKLKDVQVDFNAVIPGNNRGTLETTNAATGTTKGVEVDASLRPAEGLTLSASYAYTRVKLSEAFNPFTNAAAVIYPLYTPRNAAGVSADYEHPLAAATLRLHLDGNYSDGQYTSSTDPTLSDSYFIVNGRAAVGDIRMADGPVVEVALWARNLTNEAHAFLKNSSPALGRFAIFNEPRTYGVEARLQF
jgi:iron complex outermembrane receptor protein